MERLYRKPHVDEQWATSRQTHRAVATAIHAIASKARSPEDIWAEPTEQEYADITDAVEEYLLHGDFDPEPDNIYKWGNEEIVVDLLVGRRVEARCGADYDAGHILERIDENRVLVGWDSGVATPCQLADLVFWPNK